MVLARVISVLWLFAAAACSAEEPDAIWVSDETMRDHRLSGDIELRTSKASEVAGEVDLEVLVDPEGRVVEAKGDPDVEHMGALHRGDAVLGEAIAMVKEWKFKPFARDGRSRYARGGVEIAVLPLEKLPTRHVPFPTVSGTDYSIILSRTGCYGSCPQYTVTIDGDGRVSYTGGYYTLVGGQHSNRISTDRVAELLELFKNADFWSLDDSYRAQITDNPTYRLEIKVGSNSKSVVDYVGRQVGMPEVVRKLEEAVDEWADSERWVKGNDRTVAALQDSGFSFGSPAAAGMVLASIGEAPDSVPVELIRRGAPLDRVAVDEFGDSRKEAYRALAMARAIREGRPIVFQQLATERGLKNLSQEQLDAMLLDAANRRSLSLVKRLVELGASPSAYPRGDSYSSSPLIRALDDNYGHEGPDADQEGVVRFLLSRGARLEATDWIGWTALQHSYDDDPEFARMLITAGAKVDAHQKDGRTLLFLTDDEDVALIALKAGANRNLKDMSGRNLRQLAQRNHWRRVEALLAH